MTRTLLIAAGVALLHPAPAGATEIGIDVGWAVAARGGAGVGAIGALLALRRRRR